MLEVSRVCKEACTQLQALRSGVHVFDDSCAKETMELPKLVRYHQRIDFPFAICHLLY